MHKVNILLSVYNGEQYIETQMDSLLVQDYPNFEIHIRDDGSSDNTISILNEYKKNFPEKVFIYQGENLGYKKSFQWLMQHCGDADFFSFCDQDDYWYSNKISRAISVLENKNQNVPVVYLCDFFWCDGSLVRERKNEGYKKRHSLEKYVTLGDRNAFGFTEVFNKVVLDCVKNNECFSGCSHDEIVYMYCLCNGETVWDNEAYADYRRHGHNVSKMDLVGGNHFTHMIWRIKKFLFSSSKTEIYERMQVFYDSFQDELSNEAKAIYELYLGNSNRLKKCFYRKRYRDTLFDEIAIRILFLLGKV